MFGNFIRTGRFSRSGRLDFTDTFTGGTVKSYNLYLWRWTPRAMGGTNRHRGKLVFQFRLYKDLVTEAQRRAVAAGYPKSRWMDLFDWNQGAVARRRIS